MSNHIISAVYKRQLGSHMRKSVMALLADKASDDGSGIWASKQTLADELCCSKQTVIATVQAFLADGLLVECGTRKCATGATVEYGINVEALEALPLVACHASKQSKTLTGQAPIPVKSTAPRGQAAGPKPSRTPRLPKKDKPSLVAREKIELPDDWEPKEFGVYTQSRKVVDGWPPGEIDRQLEHFRAHHRKLGNKFKDWQEAWSTWVLNARNFGGQSGRSNAVGGYQSGGSEARIVTAGRDFISRSAGGSVG